MQRIDNIHFCDCTKSIKTLVNNYIFFLLISIVYVINNLLCAHEIEMKFEMKTKKKKERKLNELKMKEILAEFM